MEQLLIQRGNVLLPKFLFTLFSKMLIDFCRLILKMWVMGIKKVKVKGCWSVLVIQGKECFEFYGKTLKKLLNLQILHVRKCRISFNLLTSRMIKVGKSLPKIKKGRKSDISMQGSQKWHIVHKMIKFGYST